MAREHDPGRDWRSMSEEPPPSAPPKPHSPQRKAVARDIALLKLRRRKLYLILGALGGLALSLLVVLILRGGSGAPPPPSAEPAKTAAPAKPKKSGPLAPAERLKELAEREQASPKAFRTLYLAWGELRKDSPPE